MNREIIERLAIDSVGGELNEDAEALFRFYLDEHPQGKLWADDIQQVYEQTESAIQVKTTCTNVTQAVPKIGPVLRLRWQPAARWAAAILVGMFIGFTAGRWEIPARTPKTLIQVSSPASKPVETVSDFKEKYAGTFWGDKMMAMLEHPPSRGNTADLCDVRSWNTYKQYIKEKNHE